MSQKAIREYDGKKLLAQWLKSYNAPTFQSQFVQVTSSTDLSTIGDQPGNEWLKSTKLVVKPDQLIKRRGKAGLLALNVDLSGAVSWINERMGQSIDVSGVVGELNTFIIEPFLPHPQTDEYYICMHTTRDSDVILFHHEGGVDIGDVDAKAKRLDAPLEGGITKADVIDTLLDSVPADRKDTLAQFVVALFSVFQDLNFAYLEINPLVFHNGTLAVLDLAAKLDEAANFECSKKWGAIDFPPPFGRGLTEEEQFVKELDGKTGASLKLTVLNPDGRVWLMVAGGGASVVYADTVADYGWGKELANYGEYSGAPTTAQTYEYAKTILTLMTKKKRADGHKVLLIGGGIANFTDVAATFKGIIKALTEFRAVILDHGIKIFVRRAGPNWQEGLRLMREAVTRLGLDVQIFGPELHMTSIVPIALGLPYSTPTAKYVPSNVSQGPSLGNINASSTHSVPSSSSNQSIPPSSSPAPSSVASAPVVLPSAEESFTDVLFTPKTQAIVYGLQPGAVQNMLDFDFICGRESPSVACLVYPFQSNHYQKFYWNSKEILLPCLQSFSDAIRKFPAADCVVNFSSFRSVYETTVEVLQHPQITTIAIIAEGVPERRARLLLKQAKDQGVTLIGPATVGGLKPGCFRIGNAGGMLDNIVASRLYRRGSVAYVTRSGGMSNEMNNIVNQNSDGVCEGVAIGGDRFPGSTFIDHLLRYEKDPAVKILILLGEVGGVEEYEVCRLIKEGKITKPLVAWCIGTCAKVFPYDVQFGHAGACANGQGETADAKNQALKDAGAIVPDTFDLFGVALNEVFAKLVENGTIVVKQELPPPAIPVDYSWAAKLGLIRKPSAFISSISDERGDELRYAGEKISDIVTSDLGVGGVVGLLWFRRKLPDYFCRFIDLVLQLTADHGPAVSGAHNTIVCARAGKDMISSLCSGLLTIGPRFGGALDDAARKFAWAHDKKMSAEDFLTYMRKQKELIPGIGHKVKSLEDPDARVALVKDFVRTHLVNHEVFDFACEVELLTTKKKSNLILNVDGVVAVAFVDMIRSCGAFDVDEANQYIDMGVLNGLFVLGRSIGFIGHYLDQNRLKQPLYRHPTDDISYVTDL